MKELIIREATPGDASAVANLVNAAYRPQPGKGGWTHESNIVSGDRTSTAQVINALRTSTILIGSCDEQIVACVQVEPDDLDAYIGMLAIEPGVQASGLGKAMLRHAEQYAESTLGVSQFKLVVVRARTELVQFYCRRGYNETGEILSYPVNSSVGIPISENLELIVLRKPSNSSLNSDPQQDLAASRHVLQSC
ncbi:GNAT family N-acetyltransferase [Pseudomonas sp. GCM10022188]|uniref:GNAT family N-acetyltransferase n=1 Tax=Pseudomonas TaxID=286 RepID=UPI001E40A15B|nr:GNAT family N-acetyltransferase [Pseudomonas oryzagri]MCC6074344.1 GNAT family N-acetyltransferase [Pseudomonas oryzagri]